MRSIDNSKILLQNINKRFGDNQVIKNITLQITRGEILGFIGENGAGKSTFMNMLAGVTRPSSGEMFLWGEEYAPKNVSESRLAGIAFVHQELNLFDNLSVAENIFIPKYPTKTVSLRYLYKLAEKQIAKVGLTVDVRQPVSELSHSQKQLLEITKVLHQDPEVIIFDEPTTALSAPETENLLKTIKSLKKRGKTILYISHNLEEVQQLCDSIVIFKDGQLVSKGPVSLYSKRKMVSEMIGRELDQYFPVINHKPESNHLMEVEGLTSNSFGPLSFSIDKGEILGLYGLVGAGRTELTRSIYGLDDPISGDVIWKNEVIGTLSPSAWVNRGVALLPEDRREEGLLLHQSIIENVELSSLSKYVKWGLISSNKISKKSKEVLSKTNTTFQSIEQEVQNLSGGNQQKVVLSKLLMTEPEMLILDEPTKGIDVAAKKEIYDLLSGLAESGVSILWVSSEIEELIGMCHKIMVMSRGKITAQYHSDNFDRSKILEQALH